MTAHFSPQCWCFLTDTVYSAKARPMHARPLATHHPTKPGNMKASPTLHYFQKAFYSQHVATWRYETFPAPLPSLPKNMLKNWTGKGHQRLRFMENVHFFPRRSCLKYWKPSRCPRFTSLTQSTLPPSAISVCIICTQ